MAQRSDKPKSSKWAPGATVLASAAQAIMRVSAQGRSADDALAPFDHADDRASIRAITLGALRWYLRLAPALDLLLQSPQRLAADLRALLVAAAHQIEYSRNAPQATVHMAVDAARALGQMRAAGLVNAVLRRFFAERAALFERLDADRAVRTAHPQWLVSLLEQAWPEQVDRLLAANNAHPPMVLRVDRSRVDVSRYLAELAAAGLPAHALDWAPEAIELEKPASVAVLPGFAQGHVSVQDAGAQLAAMLLDAQPGMRVLDACAAPGGKTGHLLQRTPGLAEVVALDIDERRLARVKDNLARLGVTARLVAADVRAVDSFWDGRPFDRILVDAPCSSTGVIRRHPDIKLLRRPTDIPAFAETQREILGAAFRMLKPGGRLLYATCSVLPSENEEVAKHLLGSEPAARPLPMPRAEVLAPGASDREVGVQLLPGAAAGTDGFYYACVEKATSGN